jgi:acyl-CoA thioesterase
MVGTMDSVRAFFEHDRFARLAGISIVEARPGYAKAKMIVTPEHKNGAGTVHGGAFFTLADFAFAVASNGHGTLAVAATAHISFLRAVTEGTLTAEAREVGIGRKLGTYTVEITNDQGELVALFSGTAYRKSTPLSPGSPAS